jgi:putative chitinase
MIDEKFFYDTIRVSPLFKNGGITQTMVGTFNAIFKHFWDDPQYQYLKQVAYVCATAYHESAHTLNPGIREYGRGKGRVYGRVYAKTGQIYYGRGLSQLTWWYNYLAMTTRIGVDMYRNADKALETNNSVANLMIGMIEGIFTKQKLSTFLDGDSTDWLGARRVVNGTDRANLIASYAKEFYKAIRYTDEAYAQDNANDKFEEEKNVILMREPTAKGAIAETTNWEDGTTRAKIVELPDNSIASADPIILFPEAA